MIREDVILDYSRGKDLLDIGCTGRTQKYKLWPQVKAVAKTYSGIDIQKSSSPNVIQGNMEEYDFGRKFDVIVAGDVIEHVSNQGLFLDNITHHLRDEGVLIITTPNAKWPTVMLKPHRDHVIWHDRFTLAGVVRRHGLEVHQFRYYFGNKPYYNPIKRVLVWRQGMIMVCVKAVDTQA